MVKPVIVRPGNFFSENSVKYKCCCNILHVKVAAILIGVIEAIQCFGGVAGLAVKMPVVSALSAESVGGDHFNVKAVYGTGLALEILECVVVIVYFVGIFKENHHFLIPHLIMQVLGLGILIALTSFFVYMVASGPGNEFVDAMIVGLENLDIHQLTPDQLKLDGEEFLYGVGIRVRS